MKTSVPSLAKLYRLWHETVHSKGEPDGEQQCLHDELLAHCRLEFPTLSRDQIQKIVSDYEWRHSVDWDD